MLLCPINIHFGCFEKVLWKLCKSFGKSHEKSQELESCTGAHRKERRAKILVVNCYRDPRGPN